ncbi:histidine phosphatase family protein [Lentibacillus saliphilus]|uniref:histidine phosphatase family protein n=1 Tax=Lentibacillus saliphilus TaxID=2737028 RepID=UPI001C31173A|nr:histidine phosphatase family protein [Lentibacillus saliphilus]
MTKVGFVRHGITAWNKEGRAQGSSDIPLDEEGRQEAEKVAGRLCGEAWDVIYASDLLRAKETAESIAREIGHVELHFDTRLRERNGGQIEGTTEEERVLKWGTDWPMLDLGLETNESIVERGMACLNEIVEKHEGENILIVSHGAFIKRLLTHVISDIDHNSSLANTSVTCIVARDNGWELDLFNCTKHL